MKADAMELVDPDARWGVMSATDLMGMSEVDFLRAEIRHLTAALWRAAFGDNWAKAAPTCRCGRVMWRAAVPYGNSGTTRIAFCCPQAEPYTNTGHQWAVTTSPEHYLETDGGCCGGLVESMEG